MPAVLEDILGPQGAIARRLGEKYEHRPQQMEMASAVAAALAEPSHLLVEAGTGVGKSFAYLLPAIDFSVRQRKRVVISTHTISLQEQLIEKDIPLIQAVYPDEFVAVLIKGRSNYLCRRRLGQTLSRAAMLFGQDRQTESLYTIEEWAQKTADGSLSDLPVLPESDVWDKVCAEHGNCMGKKCTFYAHCFWQAARRRMHSGKILIVNHALFFADLSLRMAGIQYLPKYDAVIFDEAHTLEDVAGEHFGMKFSESAVRYQLRTLYDPKRGRGLLSTYGKEANDAIRDVEELYPLVDGFFSRCIAWQEAHGRSNGRIGQPNWIANDLSPRLRDLSLHIKAMLSQIRTDEDVTELTAVAERVAGQAAELSAILEQQLADAVYWMELPTRGQSRVSLHAAPVDVAETLKQWLFAKVNSVIMTSATLCTAGKRGGGAQRGTGGPPVKAAEPPPGGPGSAQAGAAERGTGGPPVFGSPARDTSVRQGAYLPHWSRAGAIYSIVFRLADSLPKEVIDRWMAEREEIVKVARAMNRRLSDEEKLRLRRLYSERVERYLDQGHGECWLSRRPVGELVKEALHYFDGDRYHLLAWCIMPNHVHALIRPINDCPLPRILHTWKSRTVKEANQVLRRTGEFWQPEYYDHLLRDEQDLANSVEYIWRNPEKARLGNWPWRGRNMAKIEALLGGPMPPAAVGGRDGDDHGRAARATPDDPGPAARAAASSPFDYIKSRLGLETSHELQLGSPFDYARQATLYVEADLPEPNDPLFLPAACEKILHYLKRTQGGAFVLFTSYSMLKTAADRLRDELTDLGLPMLVQGEGPPPRVLLERFRATPNAVLLGVSSFWQGIDVQGDQLRNVLIVKLPFSVPDEPIIEARLEAIRRRGGNPFMEYSVPEAIIKLKQGFGRLIRSRNDRGIVVILDSRVKTKRYGRLFLEALPECRPGDA